MRIGVFCSGGDAPGMNACVRAVVCAVSPQGHEVVGIRRVSRSDDGSFWTNCNGPAVRAWGVFGWAEGGGAFFDPVEG